LLEAHTLEVCHFPRIASLRAVANTNALEVDIIGKLFGDLGKNVWESVLRLYRQPELALFANEPQYHGGTLTVLRVGLIQARGIGDRKEAVGVAGGRRGERGVGRSTIR
jgi:hypothetical protein